MLQKGPAELGLLFQFKLIPVKIESTLLVSSKLTFSENLRCLNLALMVGAVSQNRSLSSTCFVVAGQSIYSRKAKHLKYSEDVNLEGTNSVDSILVLQGEFTHQSTHLPSS